ncbi:MAG: glucosaminidase domain-containing protein [Arcobacteraceae bacterium]
MKNLNINSKYVSPSTIIVALVVLLIIFFITKEQYILQQKLEEYTLLKNKHLQVQQYKEELIDTMNLSEKKTNFLKMIVPPLDEVYEEEINYFNNIQTLINENPDNAILESLREEYNAKDNLELLMALKPHPKSITLAQAAMESAWGESRFFRKANNIFGVWSYNANEPRIPASVMRGDKTIWLKKYPTVKEAIKDYYKILSRSWAFKEFRKLNYQKENQNPYLLVKKLQKYSEKREVYTQELSTMITYNQFTRFDDVMYDSPKVKVTPKKDLLAMENGAMHYDIPKIPSDDVLKVEEPSIQQPPIKEEN